MPVRKFDFAWRKPKPENGPESCTLNKVIGRDFPPMDRNGLGDFYVKFKLGGKKYRTSAVYESLTPRWMENIDMFTTDPGDDVLQIAVWDWDRASRDDFVGGASLHLATYDNEELHDVWVDISRDGVPRGKVHLSFMITGKNNAKDEQATFALEGTTAQGNNGNAVSTRYNLSSTFRDPKDVGMLTVRLYKGSRLRSADWNGKSDPYCFLQLDNVRCQTELVRRSLHPEWNQTFTFPVKDIHSVLHITVLDMDKNSESDFLGRIAVPLLSARKAEQRWYALKDEDLCKRTEGSILLEMNFVYNPIRATLCSLARKDSQIDEVCERFDRQVFLNHANRLQTIAASLLDLSHYIHDCLNWKSCLRSFISMLIYFTVVCFLKLWMVPLGLVLLFIRGYVVRRILHDWPDTSINGQPVLCEEDIFDVYNQPRDSSAGRRHTSSLSKNLLVGMRCAKTHLSLTQSTMGDVADLLERINNLFRFAVPWLSWMGVAGMVMVTIVMYFIPLRVVLCLFGLHLFTKKFRGSESTGSGLLPFLSRVHTDEELNMYQDLRVKELPLPEELMCPKTRRSDLSRKPDKYRWDARKQ